MIDAIIAGMSPTATRAMVIDFTEYYYLCDMVVVVKKDGAYANAASLADFAGAKITGQLGTSHYLMIDQIPGVQKMTAMDTFPDMIVALQNNIVDGYMADRPGALSATVANPDLTFAAFPEGQGFDVDMDEVSVSVGLQKGSALLAPMNEALAAIPQAERDEIMESVLKRQPLSE